MQCDHPTCAHVACTASHRKLHTVAFQCFCTIRNRIAVHVDECFALVPVSVFTVRNRLLLDPQSLLDVSPHVIEDSVLDGRELTVTLTVGFPYSFPMIYWIPNLSSSLSKSVSNGSTSYQVKQQFLVVALTGISSLK